MRIVLDLPPRVALAYQRAYAKFEPAVSKELKFCIPYWIFCSACHAIAISDWRYGRKGIRFDVRKETPEESACEALLDAMRLERKAKRKR